MYEDYDNSGKINRYFTTQVKAHDINRPCWHFLTTDRKIMARSLLPHQTPAAAQQDSHSDPADTGCQSPGTFLPQTPSCEIHLSKVFKSRRRKSPFIHQKFNLVKKCLRKWRTQSFTFQSAERDPFIPIESFSSTGEWLGIGKGMEIFTLCSAWNT